MNRTAAVIITHNRREELLCHRPGRPRLVDVLGLFFTHPPTQERIRRLQALAGRRSRCAACTTPGHRLP